MIAALAMTGAGMKDAAAQPMPQPAPAPAPAPQAPQIDPSQVDVWDVIETSDGNVFKGVIAQQTRTATGMEYRIVLPAGGGSLTIPDNKITRITKEPNPMRAQAAAGGTPSASNMQPPPGYGAPSQPAGGYPPQGEHHVDLPPPVAQEGWRVGLQFGPYFPMGDLAGSTADGIGFSTGIGGRIHVGYEFMLGRVGLKPNVAFELARFSFDDKNNTGVGGGVLYYGVQPGLEAAVHIGMFAPYAGVTFGFDHYGINGDIGDNLSGQGYTTSGSGFGFGLLFGLNIVFIPNISVGAAAEIHPGFTSIDPGQGAKSLGMGHASILFAFTYLI